jgi:hypothetical protein
MIALLLFCSGVPMPTETAELTLRQARYYRWHAANTLNLTTRAQLTVSADGLLSQADLLLAEAFASLAPILRLNLCISLPASGVLSVFNWIELVNRGV